MKTYLCLITGAWALFTAGCVGAPTAVAEPAVPVTTLPPGPPPAPPTEVAVDPQTVAPVVAAPADEEAETLDELLAPIALYPDALVALILPASTVSSDIVLAARYLNSGGDPNQVDTRAWDDSVKALIHYPDVVKWMDENLAWTQRLGEAYIDKPQEVMAAVQRDRARAQANGALTTTPQQQVTVEDGAIRIIPAQPDVIYVPRYDPEIVYVEQPVYISPDPWLTFGIGFGVGSWLAYDCDWRNRVIWVNPHRHDYWRRHHDWRDRYHGGRDHHDRPGFAHDPGWRRWSPSPGRRPPQYAHRDRPREFVRPTPIPGAPRFDRERFRGGERHRDGNNQANVRPGTRVPRPVDATAPRMERPSGGRPNPVPNQVTRSPIPTNRATVQRPEGDSRQPDRRNRERQTQRRNDVGSPASAGIAQPPAWRNRPAPQPNRPVANAPVASAPTPTATPSPTTVAPASRPSRAPDAFGRRGGEESGGGRRFQGNRENQRSTAPAVRSSGPAAAPRVIAPPSAAPARASAPSSPPAMRQTPAARSYTPAAAAPVVRSTPAPVAAPRAAPANPPSQSRASQSPPAQRAPRMERQDSDRRDSRRPER